LIGRARRSRLADSVGIEHKQTPIALFPALKAPEAFMPAVSSIRQDRIVVGGIKFHAFHGFTRLEREVGIRCSIDVEMFLSLAKAGKTDKLNHTLDYREVHQLVLDIGRSRKSYHLIESLACKIAEEILKRYKVDEVTVKVRKETPVLDGIVDHVGVEVTRRKKKVRAAKKRSR
jgi:dihydroneopterin aldolase